MKSRHGRRWAKVILSVVAGLVLVSGAVYFMTRDNGPVAWKDFDFSDTEIVNYRIGETDLTNNGVKAAGDEIVAKQVAAERERARVQATHSSGRLVTYSVTVKGSPSSNLDEFKRMVAETFNDPRGWTRAGVVFQEVASGGNFTLILSEAQYLTSYWSGCSTKYSCRVGRNVIINDDRWVGASDSWNAAGGGLREYRHMVINHEVGHFLGHADNKPVCGGAGQLAPLMQQQSIDMRGCAPNPWPLDVEIWVNF